MENVNLKVQNDNEKLKIHYSALKADIFHFEL